jgi:AraC-like DNA-binding protein
MPHRSATLPIEAAEKALAAAEETGVPRATLLATAGIGEAGADIDFAMLCALYEQAARLTGDDAFGLHVGERTAARMYGQLGYIVANSSSLGDALVNLGRYQPIWSRAAGFKLLRRRQGTSILYWHDGQVPPESRRQESEQMLSALLAFAREATAEPLDPLEVRFEHRAPADLAEHRRIFLAPLVFGASATEIVFASTTFALPIPQADPILGGLLREQAQPVLADRARRQAFLDRLQDRLKAAILGANQVSLLSLASEMAVGPRTLQRRLCQRGFTFRGVADDARIALAKDMLAGDLTLGQIAFRLGYSQTSAFHRAFHRQVGTTPGAFRRALRAHEQRFRHE